MSSTYIIKWLHTPFSSMAALPVKERDFVPALEEHPEQLPVQNAAEVDSDSTASDSDDEFDWDEDDVETTRAREPSRAKRGRAVYLAFMKLARPIRTLIFGILGCAILITPFLVFQLRFKSSKAQPHVHVWYS